MRSRPTPGRAGGAFDFVDVTIAAVPVKSVRRESSDRHRAIKRILVAALVTDNDHLDVLGAVLLSLGIPFFGRVHGQPRQRERHSD